MAEHIKISIVSTADMNKHFETKQIPFVLKVIDAGGLARSHCIAKTSDERGDRAL